MIPSLTYHNSRHINIKKDTAPCTADWQKHKFTNCYQMDQLWWELYSREELAALSVRYCTIRCDTENFHTHRHLRLKILELGFSLQSVSVNFVTATCYLPVPNCDIVLEASSGNYKDLISRCCYLYIHTRFQTTEQLCGAATQFKTLSVGLNKMYRCHNAVRTVRSIAFLNYRCGFILKIMEVICELIIYCTVTMYCTVLY